MPRVDVEFKGRVLSVVANIPEKKVTTYGLIALACGAPWAAWEVGQIIHNGPQELPYHRVVNKQGGLANGYPGGKIGQKKMLEREGIEVVNYSVKIDTLLWIPHP